jgi:hypothetical protein
MTTLVFEGGALLLGDVIIEGLLQAILTVGALLPQNLVVGSQRWSVLVVEKPLQSRSF